MSSDTANAFRAGLVIAIGTALGGTAFVLSKKFELGDRNATPLFVYLTDAGGVNKKSKITVAGLQVGEIRDIQLKAVAVDVLIPDFPARVKTKLDVAPEPERVEANEDFDQVIQELIDQHTLPSKQEIDAEKLSLEDLNARIEGAKKATRQVAKVDFFVGDTAGPVPKDSWVKKGSLGLLGANALFLEPGSSPEPLKDGERIVNVHSRTGTDSLLAQAKGIVSDVQSITDKLDRDIGGITADIKGITGELDRFVAGDGKTRPLEELMKLSATVEKAVREASKLIKNNDEQFTKMVANVQRITADLADLTGKGEGGGQPGPDGGPPDEGDIRATMSSVRKVADDLSVVTRQLKTMLGENEEELGEGVKSLRETITELNRSLSSLAEVAGRVERGEGTVGRLLTDEKMADKVESAVSGAADYVATLTSIEAHIDIGTAYNVNRAANTTTIGLKLVPKPDKFYLVEVVDDGGKLERFTERDQNGNVIRESVREEDNQIRITAMFAKRFFDFLVLRVGLIETTGGVGANLFFLEDRIELRTDLFDFRGPRDTLAQDVLPDPYLPRWRTQIKAQPIPHLYVAAGIDDVLNGWTGTELRAYTPGAGFGVDYFVGVGLTFKDDDLRAILPLIPGG